MYPFTTKYAISLERNRDVSNINTFIGRPQSIILQLGELNIVFEICLVSAAW